MPPQDLPSYVTWVIDQKPELRDTPAEVKTALHQQLQERLENLINMAILAALPTDQIPHFERLLAHSGQDEIQQFCQEQIPDMEELVAGVLVQFRNEYLGA